MKSFSILALAATVSATGWNDFGGFKNPKNTDNKCNTQQQSGWDWGDLQLGSVSSYGGFNFGGFSCEEGYGRRQPGSRFAPRTQKSLKGSCGHTKESSPSFGCGQGGDVDAFSVSTIDVIPEFDADLEFQFDMADGSTCKQRSSCSSQGSTVKNTQCGGAKNVTIVYPSGQSGDKVPKASSTCGITIPTVSFDCSSAQSTTTKYTRTSSTQIQTSSVATTTAVQSFSTATGPTGGLPSSPAETGPKPSFPVGPSGPASNTAPVASQTPPSPPSSANATTIESTSTAEIPSSVESITSTSSASTAAESTSTVEIPSSVESTTYEITSTSITSFQTTSTVYSTSIQTITSCGPEVTNCPAGVSEGQAATTTVVVAISTTICPVTATETTVYTTSHAVTQSQVVPPAETTPAGEAPPSGEVPPAGESATSKLSPIASTTAESPAKPTETLPCPSIVPACISTWNFVVGCVDNADASCYCPDSNFVQNVYECLYAYGDSDETVAEAVQYFQGICGSYAGNNPAVATGASVTTYLTATATPPVSATTIIVHETTVVPCTNEAGEPIPSSSSTVIVSTVMTVPQVVLTTVTGPSTTEVGVVPVPTYPTSPAESGAPVPSGASPAESAGAVVPSGAAPLYPTGSAPGASGVAQGTSALVPAASQTTVVTAGAGKTGASLVAAFLAVAAVLAL
ncbi:adhesin protein Mad1 [Diaporthe helianthi]|uniref:Adhesin protein Mad1 n=1 Tax=Diaporthe helianthi TaxID=158607 RepID=A0A2P5HN77_DIAHE|nr:adhesin protein Mad1 [Diaporthe helianthi]